jgi:hypothetical protein
MMFRMPSFLIFVSRVERGMPRLAAAPEGPAICPRVDLTQVHNDLLCGGPDLLLQLRNVLRLNAAAQAQYDNR